LKWVVDPVADVVTTAGDLIYGTGADAVTRLGIGTAGQVLQVNSGATAPEWATPAGGGGKVLQVVTGTITTGFVTSSTSYVDTGLTVTITPSAATSKILVFVSGSGIADRPTAGTTNVAQFILVVGATQIQRMLLGYTNFASATGAEFYGTLNFSILHSPATTSATTYKVQARVGAATSNATLQGSADQIATIVAMEIGA
jgi:hypothetical protein